MTTQTVTVTSTRTNPDEVVLVIEGREFGGWTDVRVTRGIERMPSDFQIGLTEIYPNLAQYMQIRPGQSFELWLGKSLASTGYIDRVLPNIGSQSHSITVSGRGKPADLLDCAALPGGQVQKTTLLALARKLAAPFGVEVNGEEGPTIGGGGNIRIPFFVIMIGETAWEIIERLCRIAGLLAYDMPDGSIWLGANPANLSASTASDRGGFARGASGFELGVNVKSAQANFSMDQRYSEYRGYRFSFDQYSDLGNDGNLEVTVKDPGVPFGRHRPHVVLMETNREFALENLNQRVTWEYKRRAARSSQLNLTTDSWRDSSGALYAPNTLVPVKLLDMKIDSAWLISEVTYRLSNQGTECDVTLMPPEAFSVQPTLPANAIPYDLASAPDGLGRP